MTVLVTGASGFIGKRLCKRLDQKNIPVRAVLRNEDDKFKEVVLCDFEKEDLANEAYHGIETIFHLAGCTHDVDNQSTFEVYKKINTEATTKLAHAAVENRVSSFVFVSSVKAGGSPVTGQVLDETDQQEPEGLYGKTKREAELNLLNIGAQSNMHISIIRPTLVYGPGLKGNLLQMYKAVEKGWFPPLPFVNNARSLIHVDDLIEALLLVAWDTRARNQIFIATDGQSYSSREIYEAMCHALDKNIPKWFIPYFIFLVPSFFSSNLKHKVNKLFGDAKYSSEKLESIGFKAQYSFGGTNEKII